MLFRSILGSQFADVDIYAIRIYDSALTSDGVLKNFINLLVDNEEKQAITDKNDLFDITGTEIDFLECKKKYNVFVMDKRFPSLANNNVMENVNVEVYFCNEPEWNVHIDKVKVDGQGTSSKRYWIWNQRMRFNKTSVVTNLTTGSTYTGGKWQMKPFLNPSERITAKKNFASSTQSHKMGSVNSFDDLYKHLGLLNEAIEDNAMCRNAVYQEPFVGFEKITDDEGNVIYSFQGLFTMGPDKGDKPCFGYNTKLYPNLLSIEGADNAPLGCLFRVPFRFDLFPWNDGDEGWSYNGVKTWSYAAGNKDRISWWKDAYNIAYECNQRLKPWNGTLAELNANVQTLRDDAHDYWLPNGDVYYYDQPTQLFQPSDTGSGIINIINQVVNKGYGLSSDDLVNKTAEEKNELFKKARVQKFRQEAKNFWDIDNCIAHRNWVEINAGTDNRAKNTYPYSFEGTWKWRQDDLDTIFQTDNQGLPKKKYSVETHDFYANGTPIWNGETSVFWNLIDEAFPQEIHSAMHKMLTAMENLSGMTTGSNHDRLMGFYNKYYFSKAQEHFAQSLYNADAKFTYESAKWAQMEGRYTNDTDPLTQALGDWYSGEYQWISYRMIYMMSKYSYGMFAVNGTDNITVRASGNTITYQLTPAIDLYPAIANGQSIVNGGRTFAGETCEILVDLAGASDQQNTIQGVSYLSSIGDWYDKRVSGTMNIQGKRLREVKLGHKTEPITIDRKSVV